jgi:hypothetical protein
MTMLSEEAADVGQDKTNKDFTQKYDSAHGTYKDPIEQVAVEERLPTVSMPKGPDPDPFVIGPMTGGERI